MDLIQSTSIVDEMQRSYYVYSMSVIRSRALPDGFDGLKPVHRRILYAMWIIGMHHNKQHKKSARVVGEVMSRFHPHGDTAIYDSLVRLAQDFSMRYPLIDGQGNFGSIDGDSPAAMRYTEARLAELSQYFLLDIDKETVPFQDNYDATDREPVVLPVRFPAVLVNGAMGVAVGVSTNIPTHNINEVINACIHYIQNDSLEDEELFSLVGGPDFPTGGLIVGRSGIRDFMKTGRGTIVVRGKTHIEEFGSNKKAIIITEVPYQVNKAKLVERIAELARDGAIDNVIDIRDESNQDGIRVVIELRKDANEHRLFSILYEYSQLQINFPALMLVVCDGVPKILPFASIIANFVSERELVVRRRLLFYLRKYRERLRVLAVLKLAIDSVDDVVRIIKSSKDSATAKLALTSRGWPAKGSMMDLAELVGLICDKDGLYHITEEDAGLILDMRLGRLTALEHDKVDSEIRSLIASVKENLFILSNRDSLKRLLISELDEIKSKFDSARRTQILSEEPVKFSGARALIPKESVVITLSFAGYVKQVLLSKYKTQARGGKGRSGIDLRVEDESKYMLIATTHSRILWFFDNGMVYKMWASDMSTSELSSKGKYLAGMLGTPEKAKVASCMVSPDKSDPESENKNMIFVTKNGFCRRNKASDFFNINVSGKIAIKLADNDELIDVCVCEDQDYVLIMTKYGRAIRFSTDSLRVFKGRASSGVRAIRLAGKDNVVAVTTAKEDDNAKVYILSVASNGYGKLTPISSYRLTSRGGGGVRNIVLAEGATVVTGVAVSSSDDAILMTDKGRVIRIPLANVRITSRGARGVKLIDITASDQENVCSVTIVNENLPE